MNAHENLYRLRVGKGYSQEAIANELGIDYTTYARYEKGTSEMKASQLVKLAKLYNVTIDELLYGKEYEQKNLDELLIYAQESTERYNRRKKVTVSIDVDGDHNNLQESIALLNDINQIINKKAS